MGGRKRKKMIFNEMMIDERKLQFVQYLSSKVQVVLQLDFKQKKVCKFSNLDNENL